jgi:hypothetical protein
MVTTRTGLRIGCAHIPPLPSYRTSADALTLQAALLHGARPTLRERLRQLVWGAI